MKKKNKVGGYKAFTPEFDFFTPYITSIYYRCGVGGSSIVHKTGLGVSLF